MRVKSARVGNQMHQRWGNMTQNTLKKKKKKRRRCKWLIHQYSKLYHHSNSFQVSEVLQCTHNMTNMRWCLISNLPWPTSYTIYSFYLFIFRQYHKYNDGNNDILFELLGTEHNEVNVQVFVTKFKTFNSCAWMIKMAVLLIVVQSVRSGEPQIVVFVIDFSCPRHILSNKKQAIKIVRKLRCLWMASKLGS